VNRRCSSTITILTVVSPKFIASYVTNSTLEHDLTLMSRDIECKLASLQQTLDKTHTATPHLAKILRFIRVVLVILATEIMSPQGATNLLNKYFQRSSGDSFVLVGGDPLADDGCEGVESIPWDLSQPS